MEIPFENPLGSGSFRLTKKKVKLTPKYCQEFLELQEVQGERVKKEPRVETIVSAMVSKTFRYEIVQLMVAVLKGVFYRINGQHTAQARLELADMPEYSQEVELFIYEVQTEEDLRSLYGTTDRNGGRTDKETTEATLAGYKGWANVAKRFLNLIRGAYAFHSWEDPKERRSQGKVGPTCLALKTGALDLGVRVGTFLTNHASKSDASHLRRTAVVAAMFGTFQKNVAESQEFWKAVLDGELLKASDPRNKLRAILLGNSVGQGRSSGKDKLSEEQMYRYCIQAWNLHRDKRSCEKLRLPKGDERPKCK